jgi:hypothetical protein
MTERLWVDVMAERVAVLGTPRIFGKEMQLTGDSVPYATRWGLEFCGIGLEIRHRGNNDTHGPWEATLRIPYKPEKLVATRQEAEVFLETQLRKLRNALVEEIPQP